MASSAAFRTISKLHFIFLFLFLASACTTQIGPSYDPNLYEKIANENTEILKFFATVSQGTSKQDFTSRARQYDEAIGTLDALAMEADARPMPSDGVTSWIRKQLADRQLTVKSDGRPASVIALEEASRTIRTMREADRESAMNPFVVEAYRNQTAFMMKVALAYENYLNRSTGD
jgi:hypothetical protein